MSTTASDKRDTKLLKAVGIVGVTLVLIFAPVWLLVGAKDPDRCEYIPGPTTSVIIAQVPATDG